MGEKPDLIFEIGSPDIDLMKADLLPSLNEVLNYYAIGFKEYAILMFHPVTSEEDLMTKAAQNLINEVVKLNLNFIVIYPNNDLGSGHILRVFEQLENKMRFKIFPSLRFEYFLTLLKNALFIIGNSSAGIREAPHFGVPTINIGSRQQNRSLNPEIIQANYDPESIEEAISKAIDLGHYEPVELFGDGKSNEMFLDVISNEGFWNHSVQKVFID
jgi:UDP-N-acetylglucosamine 2-epimerase (hydrolysing)